MVLGTLVLDPENRVSFADDAAATLLDAPAASLPGRHASSFFPDAHWEDPVTPQQCDTVGLDARGRQFATALSVQPLPQATGRATLVTFVSPAPASTADPLPARLAHTQRLAGIGTLTASIAHELTNPLGIITATCGNLVHEINDGNLDTDLLRRYIDMIDQSAWRSARIVEVLRHYSQDRGLEAAVTSLNMVVEDALTLLRAQFLKEFGIRFETELDPELHSVVCDHNRLTQVVINLLANARDAMQPDGGTITIRTWTVPAGGADNGTGQDGRLTGSDHAAGAGPGEEVALSVRDEGSGIAPEIMPQIYEPFFTTKPSGMGTGLGLFIAQGIVHDHKGRIWAENNPDRGATFTVVLPQRP